MRFLIVLTAALLIQQQAFAGYGKCRSQVELVCETKLNRADGSFRYGPSGAGTVYDQEPEYFNPAECEASVVLNTDLGKFVANYRDYEGTVRAWIDPIDGGEQLLIDDAAISTERKVSVTIPAAPRGKYKSVTFTCYTQVNSGPFNPRE